MTATPATLALAALVILYFLLSAADSSSAPAGHTSAVGSSSRSSNRRRPTRRRPSRRPPPQTRTGRTSRRARTGGTSSCSSGGGSRHAGAPSAKTAAGTGEPLLPRRPQFSVASVAGVLQRRINEQYDALARASEARCLTIEQVSPCVRAFPLSSSKCSATTTTACTNVCVSFCALNGSLAA
jgi:hypothetical protein